MVNANNNRNANNDRADDMNRPHVFFVPITKRSDN